MNNLPIIALVGIAILMVSTVGFGASINSSDINFNLIGASDNNAVTVAPANITALVWTEEVSNGGTIETDEITFAVGNEDITEAHAFQVCAVIEGPAATFTPAAGLAPNCVTTNNIPASGNGTNNIITFSAVNVTDIVDISFTIEQLDQQN